MIEFNLSDKIQRFDEGSYYWELDVEEAVKELKEGIEKIKQNGVIDPVLLEGLIDKVMGEKLI